MERKLGIRDSPATFEEGVETGMANRLHPQIITASQPNKVEVTDSVTVVTILLHQETQSLHITTFHNLTFSC